MKVKFENGILAEVKNLQEEPLKVVGVKSSNMFRQILHYDLILEDKSGVKRNARFFLDFSIEKTEVGDMVLHWKRHLNSDVAIEDYWGNFKDVINSLKFYKSPVVQLDYESLIKEDEIYFIDGMKYAAI